MTQTMTYALSRLTLLDWLVVGVGLWLVAAIETTKPGIDPLSRRDQVFLEWGETVNGFGAFARGNNGSFGWVSGRGSAEAASQDALAYCFASGTGCRITAFHDSTVHNNVLDRNITPTMLRHFKIYLQKPWPRAFAISEDGSVGYASGETSSETASQIALRTCAQYQAQKNRPEFLKDRPCFVVHTGR